MRIQHNIAALNSHRQLTNNNTSVSKNLEKLSSGFKINRAGDDAAGLAISEKMRAQITGLQTAQKNANDGISLVQTAEGALTEVHSMLNRMTELATQSANGTYDNNVDRANLQKELDSLMSEIDRISEGTNFNGINLLDGSLGGARVTSTKGTAASGGVPATKATFDVDLEDLITGGVKSGEDLTIGGTTVASGSGTKASFKVDVNGLVGAGGIVNTKNFVIGDKTIAGTVATDGDKDASLAAIKTAVDGKTVTIDGTAYAAAMDDKGVITFTAAAVGDKTLDAAAQTTIKAAIKNDTTAYAGEVSGIVNGKAAGDLGKDATLAAIKNSIADKEFTIDGKKYTAALNGTKLSFTAVDAGADEPDASAIATAIKNNTTAVAEAKITTVPGKDETAPTNPATNAKTTVEFSSLPKAGDTIKIGDTTYEFVANGGAVKGQGNTAITIGADAETTATNFKNAIDTNTAIQGAEVKGSQVIFSTADTAADKMEPVTIEQKSQGLTLQIGDTAQEFNKLNVSVGSMNCKSLGLEGLNISTQEGAQAAVQKIKDAINLVSSTRGDLGAIQNRLEHTINNLSVTTENMTAAESRIRDVDMAQEMMDFTKNNILVQASQAMLAQANQLPQGVLQLLQ